MAQPHAGLGDSYFNDRDRYRPTRGLSIAAIIGIALACVLDVVTTAINWTQYNVVVDYFNDRAQDSDLDAADNLASTWAIPFLVVLLGAGIVFLIWWHRTHYNARWFGGPDSQGRTGGWVIGGWFCPIVNLWFPREMVADAWRASSPRQPAPGTTIVTLWWLLYIPSNLLSLYASRVVRPGSTPTSATAFSDALHTVAVLETVSTVLYLGAGVLIIAIILQLTRWQNTPRGPVIDTVDEA